MLLHMLLEPIFFSINYQCRKKSISVWLEILKSGFSSSYLRNMNENIEKVSI